MRIFIDFIKRGGVIVSALLFSFLNSNAQSFDNQQLDNYNFEQWVNEGQSTVEPARWHSFMSASGGFSNFMSQQIEPSSNVRPGSDGSKSARIFSKSILGITANGNMTTGRINAGTVDPSGTENYNYTQRNSDFCMPLTVMPDSLTVWVSFRASNPGSQASIITAIHGDSDFQMLGDGSYYPANMLCATANMQYSRTCAAGEELVWKRLSIPFTAYPDICSDYRYILTTFTTNKDAGGGSANDEVFIDDICMIYNPSIEIGAIENLAYHYPTDGTALPIEVPFTLSGTMSVNNLNKAPNQVIAQMSDVNGSFANPYELGRVTTDESGVIHGNIPYGVPNGSGYRVRVVSTNYPMTSGDNGNDITIAGNTHVPSAYAANVVFRPNPTNGMIMIENIDVESVKVYNMQGQCVGRFNGNSVNIESLPKGMYFLMVEDLQGNIYADRVVKI